MPTSAAEARARRGAARQNLILQKIRLIDKRPPWAGTFRIVNKDGEVVAGDDDMGGYGLTLGDVEQYLIDRTWPPKRRKR